ARSAVVSASGLGWSRSSGSAAISSAGRRRLSGGVGVGSLLLGCHLGTRRLLEELVAAELVAQGGDDLGREGVGLAGREALEQRDGEHGRGDGPVDRLLDSPPSLARVLDVALDVGELLLVGQRQLGEIE